MDLSKIKAKIIFNAISVIYGALDGMVKRFFKQAADISAKHVHLAGQSVLDVGSGTGAWSALFYERGAKPVVGIDFAQAMVYVARKRYGKQIQFTHCDAEKLSQYADKSYDIVTSSFVLHGMKQKQRKKVLEQMRRVARKTIIVHDYSQNWANVIMLVLEILEGSDYFFFRKNFYNEFTELFPRSKRVAVSDSNALYIADLEIERNTI